MDLRNPLDVWHVTVARALGGGPLAPVRQPLAILDVACGTGLWAREMARAFPAAAVLGFDMDTKQIDRAVEEGAWRGDDLLPPNCRFTAGDALRAFLFPDASFDYTHARFISPFVPTLRFSHVIGEMARVTRPGGWIEVLDVAHFETADPALRYLFDCLRALYDHNGLTLEPGSRLQSYLDQAGLRHVRARSATMRAGAGDSPATDRVAADLVAGLINAGPFYVQQGIASEQQVRAAIQEAQRPGPTAGMRITLTATWGQHPLPK